MSEEEVKDRSRLFKPCRWINFHFTHISFLAEGKVVVAAVASEAEKEFFPGGVVVGGEISSNRVCSHHHINLIWISGGETDICFRISTQTKGVAYSVGGGGVLCWWRHTLLMVEAEAKR